jgi:hypothetical protein
MGEQGQDAVLNRRIVEHLGLQVCCQVDIALAADGTIACGNGDGTSHGEGRVVNEGGTDSSHSAIGQLGVNGLGVHALSRHLREAHQHLKYDIQ